MWVRPVEVHSPQVCVCPAATRTLSFSGRDDALWVPLGSTREARWPKPHMLSAHPQGREHEGASFTRRVGLQLNDCPASACPYRYLGHRLVSSHLRKRNWWPELIIFHALLCSDYVNPSHKLKRFVGLSGSIRPDT